MKNLLHWKEEDIGKVGLSVTGVDEEGRKKVRSCRGGGEERKRELLLEIKRIGEKKKKTEYMQE